MILKLAGWEEGASCAVMFQHEALVTAYGGTLPKQLGG